MSQLLRDMFERCRRQDAKPLESIVGISCALNEETDAENVFIVAKLSKEGRVMYHVFQKTPDGLRAHCMDEGEFFQYERKCVQAEQILDFANHRPAEGARMASWEDYQEPQEPIETLPSAASLAVLLERQRGVRGI